jgi:hypothetical protein
MLFVRKDDIEYATEKGWEGLRIFIQNKGAQISSEATEIVAKDSCNTYFFLVVHFGYGPF